LHGVQPNPVGASAAPRLDFQEVQVLPRVVVGPGPQDPRQIIKRFCYTWQEFHVLNYYGFHVFTPFLFLFYFLILDYL